MSLQGVTFFHSLPGRPSTNTAGQFCQTLLQLLAVVVGGGILDLLLATRRISKRASARSSKERKDRVDDAVHATKAAIEEGVVAEGGAALLYATNAINGLNTQNGDQKVGVDIVRDALKAPMRQIAENAGAEGAIVVGKPLERAR